MNKTGINNLAPKIISILFALVLWIYVIGTINPRTTENFPNVPVKLLNLEELAEQKLVLVGDEDFKVRVKVTGRRDEVSKISTAQIQVKADLRGATLGSNSIPLEVTVPNNIEVDVSPRFIRVELEEVIRKQKNVKVVITGTPKENFSVGKPQYKPNIVWVEGPESYVNSVESVVATIDVTGESGELVLSLPLKPVNSRGEEVKNVSVKTSYADVTLDIDLLKAVPIKLDEEITAAEGYVITDVELSRSEIMLRGNEEVLRGITEITTELVEAKNLTKNESIEVNLNLPQGVYMEEDTPIVVNISVEEVEEEVYEINKDKILFNNLEENLKIEKSNIPENIEVKIFALRSVLDSIKENDIHIEVDLTGLNANEYTIEPVVRLPFIIERDIKDLQLNPKTITIELLEK